MASKPKLNYSAEVGIKGKDLFQTPNYATELLLPFIPKGIEVIWECAVGDGKISNIFIDKGYRVFRSDIRANLLTLKVIHNFLTDPIPDPLILDWNSTAIITNPPFSLKKQFFNRCIQLNIPFALLLPADYSLWIIEAIERYGCEKIIPTRRIDFITPNGRKSTAQFHSMWLTHFFNLGKTETFVELTQDMKRNI